MGYFIYYDRITHLYHQLTVQEFSIPERQASRSIQRRGHHVGEEELGPLSPLEDDFVKVVEVALVGRQSPVLSGESHFAVAFIHVEATVEQIAAFAKEIVAGCRNGGGW